MNRFNRTSDKRRQAFTLLEIIVAVALMNMIALSLYSSLHITSKAKRSVTEAISPYQNLAPVFSELRRDLQAALQPNGVLAGGFVGESLTAGQNIDADYLQFCSASYSPHKSQVAGNIVQVSYELVSDQTLQETVLVRNTTVNLLSSKTADTPKREVIGRRIRSFNLRYFDGYSWLDSWDSTAVNDTLPLAVEITLTADLTPKNTERDRLVRTEKMNVLTCRRVIRLSCAGTPELSL
jgi:type II secretion system protein J